MNSDTPRTDESFTIKLDTPLVSRVTNGGAPMTDKQAFILKNDEGDRYDVVLTTFAAQLERENNQLRSDNTELNRQVTLNRENWRMDAESKDNQIYQLREGLRVCKEALEKIGYNYNAIEAQRISRATLSHPAVKGLKDTQ